MKIKNKVKEFDAIYVTGHENQFGELKRMCGNNITITFETCYIDDYWLVKLYDCLGQREVTVPNFSYIIKLDEDSFTVINALDFENRFEKIDEEKDEIITHDFLIRNEFVVNDASNTYTEYFIQKDNEDGTELYNIELSSYKDTPNKFFGVVRHDNIGEGRITLSTIKDLKDILRCYKLNDVADKLK